MSLTTSSGPDQAAAGVDERVLRAAVAAYLGRYRGESRVHTGSAPKVFLIWCSGQELDPLQVGRAEIERYVRWLQEIRRYQPSTVSRRLSVVVGFCRVCVIDQILAHSPADYPRVVVENDFRVGDVLEVSCPFTPARVIGVSSGHVSIRWPWWQSDPDAVGFEWNGNVAIARGPDTPDWSAELFRTEPSAELLQAGAECRVGIPPTVVHVIEAQSFDPPLETGRLPRPHREVVVLRRGVSAEVDAVEPGTGINPDDDIPLVIDLVFRPYAFLNIGDDVADRHGRLWRFDGPWDLHAYDEQGGIPIWPLVLIAGGDGSVDAERQALVATATTAGSHRTQIETWRRAVLAEPPAR